MSVISGPNIVLDGLVLYLDAANPKSYPGTGSTWNDLSGNGHHAYGHVGAAGPGSDPNNFPIWQSNNQGRFYFDGSKGLTILTDMGSHTEITADFWFFKQAAGTNDYIFDGRNDGGSWWITNYNAANNIDCHGALQANDPSTYQGLSNWFARWVNIIITSNASGSAIWADGEAITDDRLVVSNSLTESLGQYFIIGSRYTWSGQFVGHWSNLRFYNRVLTDFEIQQNYNAHRSRFGL